MALLVNIVDSSGAVVADGVVVVGQGSSVEHGGASASAATWEQFWICCCQFSPDRRINFHPKHVAWKKRGNTGVQKVLGTKSDELILVLRLSRGEIKSSIPQQSTLVRNAKERKMGAKDLWRQFGFQ